MFGSSRKHFADAQSAQLKIQRNQFQDEIIRQVLEALEQSQNLTDHLLFARDFLATDTAKLQLKNDGKEWGSGSPSANLKLKKISPLLVSMASARSQHDKAQLLLRRTTGSTAP